MFESNAGNGRNGTGTPLWALARRSVVRTVRQPGAIVPAPAFPLFFMAVISAGAGSATRSLGSPRTPTCGSSWRRRSGRWAALALRTGSSESVQGVFPLAFVVIGFSSFFIPRSLVTVGWFKAIASWNPASYLIEGMRSLVITGWDCHALAMAFAMAAGLTVAGMALSAAALRRRLSL